MEVSQDNIKIARFVANAIGFKPQVFPYWDDDKKHSIDILDLVDPLDSNKKFYCTIGISDFPNLIDMKVGEENIPVELLITGYKEFDKVPNILSTCGFFIMKNRWTSQPGSIFKDIVQTYYADVDMKHIMFTSPFFWQDKLQPLELESKVVNWLLAVPISDKELLFKNENGVAALEALFDKKETDVFNLNRKSVV